MIDEIPYLHGYDAQHRFRAIMTTHIQYALTPCIMIYSNVTEGKYRPTDLEKLIDPHLLYDQSMVLQQKSNFKNVLNQFLTNNKK